MVVCKTIYEECSKGVQRVRKMEVFVQEGGTVNREKMARACNAVEMDDCKTAAAVPLEFGGNNPHPSVGIRFISHWAEPLNEGARVVGVPVGEREEQEDPANHHPSHAWKVRGGDHEDSVVSGILTVPIRIGTDTFSVHPPGSAEIARGIEASHGREEYREVAVKSGAGIDGNLGRWDGGIRIQLVIEEAAYELGQPRLVNMGRQFCDGLGKSTFWEQN